MVALSPAFLALAVFCSSAIAAPWPATTRQHTHNVRSLPNGLRVKTYHPASTFKTFSDGIDPPVSSSNGFASSFKDSAMSFINQELGSDQVEFRSSFEASHAKHVYAHQKLNGFRVANGVAHTTLNKGGKVVAFSSSFVTPQNKPATVAKISEAAALKVASTKAGATPTSRKVDLEYFSEDNGNLALSYVVQAKINDNGHLVEIFVDAVSSEVVGIIDFTTSLTYHVVPVTKQSPDLGLETLVDPEDLESSPKGWSSGGSTEGNNVLVAKNDVVGQQSSDKGFEFEYDATVDPATDSQVDLARTNVFYIINRVHDIAYRYGFTEAGFNFQDDNNGKGGAGNDRVIVSVQDGSSMNNADMTTPGDGENGQMHMYLWDITNPHRDGAVENDIVVHEFTHGITNRLTGGGTGRCLGTAEAGGMGEGWSDAVAFWMEQTGAEQKDYTMGSYVTGNPSGIRSHPYSLSTDVNPYTYATLAEKHEVHDIGEIWANTLINVYGALVEASGFDADAANNAELTTGNAIWFHLFIDSLSIQNCNPTFINARDAWIQADKDRYDGANTCTLWKAFASRGLGVGATEDRVDNNDIPEECNGAQPTPPTTDVPEPTEPAPTESEPVPTETSDEPEEPTETSDEPEEPTETPEIPEPEPTDTETDLPFPPFPTDTDLPFPSDEPEPPMPPPTEPPVDLPGEGEGDEPSEDGEICPLLGIPKNQLPSWWPFDFC